LAKILKIKQSTFDKTTISTHTQSLIKLLEARFRNKLVGPSKPIYGEKFLMTFL